MAVRQLTEAVIAWRIGDPNGRFPIYSGEGSVRNEGRWHRKGQDIIYSSEHYGTAMLEKVAHYNGILPPSQHFITIDIPVGVSFEVITKDSLPGWDDLDCAASRAFGTKWIHEEPSGVLFVPSVVSREERNILINPGHADAARIRPGREQPVRWDQRLFHHSGQ
jgi:RES domain-containing protein